MGSKFTYNAAAYARASKDDEDSGTIENQIELIRHYVTSTPEIRIVSVREDSGFSGIDFIRPSFTEMMEDIEAGKINCVIVKDLSRLGRNYIEVGELMDITFPKYSVRLIAVNDNYDSLNPRSDADEILLPFKNLMNEQYLRDFSIKIRSHLNVKRKNGEFVAPFAPYGYKRDENDKHRLAVDEYAANVVRTIFRLKIEGMSQIKIAKQLNLDGEPSPAEYKKRNTTYVSAFQTKDKATWSSVAIGRILSNPVYTGVLVQGKQTTPSYKVKKRIQKSENEWNVIQDTHEAIIDKRDFEIVSRLLKQDTRSKSDATTVHHLAGFLYCADCGNSMVRSMSGKYTYYVCASSLWKGNCTSHCILDKKLEVAVFDTITKQIAHAVDIDKALESSKISSGRSINSVNLNAQIADRKSEIKTCEIFKSTLYEDYKNGLISRDDFINFNSNYTARIKALQQVAMKLRKEAEALLNDGSQGDEWLKHITKFHAIPELNRQVVVSLIDRIEIYNGKRIDIKMRYQDSLETVQDILNNIYAEEAGCD